MSQGNHAQQLTFTLGPSGMLLACSPALKTLLGVGQKDRVTFSRLSGSIQPTNSFLALINSGGNGLFTVADGLFEISAKRDAHTNQTHLQLIAIVDDNETQLGSQSTPNHSISPSDVSKLPQWLTSQLSAADSTYMLEKDPTVQAYQITHAIGFPYPLHLTRVHIGLGSQYASCLKADAPFCISDMNILQGSILDGGSLFEYRAATGGKLPLSAIALPILCQSGVQTILVAENYTDPFAFSQVDLSQLVQDLIAQFPNNLLTYSEPEPVHLQFQALDSVLAMLDRSDNVSPLLPEIQTHLQFILGRGECQWWKVEVDVDFISLVQDEKNGTKASIQLPTGLSTDKAQLFSKLDSSEPVSALLGKKALSAIVFPVMTSENEKTLLVITSQHAGDYNNSDLNAVSIYGRVLKQKRSKVLYAHNDAALSLNDTESQNAKRNSQNNAIWEALVDGVLVTDSINRVVFSNKALTKYLDPTHGSNGEATIESAARQLNGNLSAWKEKILAWSVQSDQVIAGDVFEENIKLPSGRVVAIHLSPVLWGKEFLGTVTVFRDISYEFEFDRLKTDFITSISHELRTPLTSIQGYVDLLLMGVTGNLSEEQRSFMMIVKNNSERLNSLINDMLELTTIEAGKANLSIHPTDIFTLANEVLERFRERSQKENKLVEFSIEADSALPLALADPERAKQIFDNLLSNAYSFTQQDGKIVISLKQSGHTLQVDITDNGVGIARDQRDLIFDQFTWVDHPADQSGKGIGLGLPIVKQLVEMQNGKIWVESSGVPGEGATFSFTLPINGN